MTGVWLLSDTIARIVLAREVLEDGDLAFLSEILRDLEADLVIEREEAA